MSDAPYKARDVSKGCRELERDGVGSLRLKDDSV